MYNILFILLVQVGYVGQLYFIATMVYFTLPFNIYNVQTHNTKYYLLSLPYIFFNDIYNFSIMYMAWCITVGHSQYIIILIYYQYHSNIAIH